MAGVEYVEFNVSDTGPGINIEGTPNAWWMASILSMKHAKQKTSAPGKLSRIYAVAQEMQMDLVAAYRNRIFDEVYSCRCFQGDADFIASLLEDPEYDEYAREVKEMFNRAMANDTDNA